MYVCIHAHIDTFTLSNRPALLLICYQNETSVNKESPKALTKPTELSRNNLTIQFPF